MNRTTAIISTIVTAFLCGIPAFVLICMGVIALFGAQAPEIMSQNPGSSTDDVMLGAGIFLCIGTVLLIIPIVVGVVTLRLSKKDESVSFENIPPPS